ncbi:uncharacterized protein Z520_03915 [Fonsecaea multimorphosa CBS 102226]|uniref:Cytochrome b561 domain-containing protein n=1 Tax=Fonsecaea multimorphosa CBS 102226 TaxID=1442371 RepID=A0A0D2KAP8_9EURO|nr:uncharacterized protein Z520_03915 [Fonsecaea multimorphosa CBS 102226]KIY00230.1 hypothetical protein Z520_03915 [Fonsecaea multimorphosa CBS 102226]OAL27422.1 hypothetical protein AYO22_03697 [Fonsecaea multimorphosa]
MHGSFLSLPATLAILLLSVLATAYRPLQFVKHTGQSGRADQAFSMVNYFNETTQQSDLYVRMWMFRYKDSNKGWAALGLGPRMKGAMMFIIYGDPLSEDKGMTLTVRTVDGHHPPRPTDDMKDFYSGDVPEVEVVTAHFEDYTGEWYSDQMQAKPSHLGIADFIVRGYDRWGAAELGVHNDTTKQAMIWSSNFRQDFEGDFSVDRNIDMHQFGLGFGFLWVDLLNARSDVAFFGDINELNDHSGISETAEPKPPTEDELKKGDEIIAAQTGGGSAGEGDSKEAVPEEPADKPDDSTPPATDAKPDSDATTPGADDGSKVEQPVKTVKQWNIRSMMWHLHGFFMTMPFLIGYPLAIYLLRSPRTSAAGTAFNYHWTVNALSSIFVSIGALIGFVTSRSISITHQYVGILIVCALAAQLVLGWRHHVVFVTSGGRKTWMSTVHVILGRVVFPVGVINVVSGLMLRQYGWPVISLCVALAVVEVVVLTLVVGQARNRRPGAMQKGTAAPTADEAEEYFQLAGDDDDDDEFSDDDGETGRLNAEERAKKEAERDEQRKKLAKLDRV